MPRPTRRQALAALAATGAQPARPKLIADENANTKASHVTGERRENGMSIVQRYAERRTREDFRHHTLELDRFLFCHYAVLASVATRSGAALGCGGLELAHNAGLHVVTPATQLLQQS